VAEDPVIPVGQCPAVLFIPGGQQPIPGSNPYYIADIEKFWIQKYPVKVSEYLECMAAGACMTPAYSDLKQLRPVAGKCKAYPSDQQQHLACKDPACVCASPKDMPVGAPPAMAANYCDWRYPGSSIPTLAMAWWMSSVGAPILGGSFQQVEDVSDSYPEHPYFGLVGLGPALLPKSQAVYSNGYLTFQATDPSKYQIVNSSVMNLSGQGASAIHCVFDQKPVCNP
jgi:hypothetical protein